MLKTMVDNQILFVVMGVMAGIGLFSKIVIWFTLKKIVKEAGNMAQSTHKLMKLVKAKFEHACMVSEKVQNVKAFVRKYIYEYRMFGMRIHTWRQLEKQSIWMIGILAILCTRGKLLFVWNAGWGLVLWRNRRRRGCIDDGCFIISR